MCFAFALVWMRLVALNYQTLDQIVSLFVKNQVQIDLWINKRNHNVSSTIGYRQSFMIMC